MKELVMMSGKGGTGKTSVTAAFAGLAADVVLADCDVDAADLHLIFQPRNIETQVFRSGREAVIRPDCCTGCGRCRELCRFEAVDKAADGKFRIDGSGCEGCGVCVRFCPAGAIDFPEKICGEYHLAQTRVGPMIHAAMLPGAENSGKLVSEVRKLARQTAERERRQLILADGPPGIGCPAIAAITGADAVLAVTEPTAAGAHDLDRLLALTRHFGIRTLVCVNKYDLNADMTERIFQSARRSGAIGSGMIPYDRTFMTALSDGKSVIDFPESPAAEAIRQLWRNVCQEM